MAQHLICRSVWALPAILCKLTVTPFKKGGDLSVGTEVVEIRIAGVVRDHRSIIFAWPAPALSMPT
jgi:hypothetical protein